MIKNVLYICISIILSNTTIGQTGPTLEWVKTNGGIGEEISNCIVTDIWGFVYVTGHFEDTIDLDPGVGVDLHYSNGGDDIFIMKLTSTGNLVWARTIGGPTDDKGISMDIDNLGNVYVTGHFSDTVDFDPGAGVTNLISNGLYDVFVLKLTTDGYLSWIKSIGGTSGDFGRDIRVDQIGNTYIGGTFKALTDFDPGVGTYPITATSGSSDLYVLKLDSNGDFIWVSVIGNADNDVFGTMELDNNDNILLSGSYKNTIDLDPTAAVYNVTSQGYNDLFIEKLDPNGTPIWIKVVTGGGSASSENATFDSQNNLYLTGDFTLTQDFDPGSGTNFQTSSGSADIYILKLNDQGNLVWVKRMGGSNIDTGYSITIDLLDELYLSARITGTSDIDPGPSVQNISVVGGEDILIEKIDTAGSLLWYLTMGSINSDACHSIHCNASGDIYLTGHYSETIDFDPGPGVINSTVAGIRDIYMQKYSQCFTSYGTDFITSCSPIIWLDGITYSSTVSGPTFTLSSSGGCDSIVTLDLTINSVDTTVLVNEPTLTANLFTAQYQWLDCNNGYSPVGGATSQSFTPTQNGIYALAITANGCTDTSSCYPVTTIGLNELPIVDHQLVKIVDTMGRETKDKPNTLLIYIYSDGTTEKVFRVE